MYVSQAWLAVDADYESLGASAFQPFRRIDVALDFAINGDRSGR
jgi:hypothetical protein